MLNKKLISFNNVKVIQRFKISKFFTSNSNKNDQFKLSRSDKEKFKQLVNFYADNHLPDENLENQVKNLKVELKNKVCFVSYTKF